MTLITHIDDSKTQAGDAVRILSVSGGGLLGVIPVAFLSRYEELGRSAYGRSYRICDSYDLVGGASTGGIIATAIALGCEVDEILSFYLDHAPDVFARPRLSLPGLSPRYNAARLLSHFEGYTQGRCLRRDDLRTHLAVPVRDMEAGRQVLLSTTGQRGQGRLNATISNAEVDLGQLLRATTAAPGLFAPAALPIGDAGKPVMCIDGAVGMFGDPALLLWQAATGQDGPWPGKAAEVLSLGTGGGQPRASARSLTQSPAAILALKAFSVMIRDAMTHSAEVMQTFADHDRNLSFDRFDIPLDNETLSNIGIPNDRTFRRQLRSFSDCRGKRDLYDAVRKWAAQEITKPLPLARNAGCLSPCPKSAA